MDTVITSLSPKVGAILMENVSIIQIVSMFSIGAYNALETAIVAFDTFKHYRSLYFWSIQVASWGILVHALPAMARFVSQASNLATSIPFMIGWYAMVTGQAVVLYSRLHLVVSDARKVRWVLWMINIYPIFAPSQQVASEFSRLISDFWAPDAEEVILAKLRDKEEYDKSLCQLFDDASETLPETEL